MGLATVRCDVLPIYERPSLDSLRRDEALYGMSVQVLQEMQDSWCHIRTEHNTEGYAMVSALETNVEIATAWRKYKKVVVLASYIDIQSSANFISAVLASVPRGAILVALGQPGIDGWQKVGLTGGEVGYTRASYLGEVITEWTALSEADMRWNLVETALSYNGAAYRVGGRTPMGIDSVGLVAISYMLNGVIIPQEIYLRPGSAIHQIDPAKMQEGDIIYFPGSVGIYIGDGRFVHSTDYVDNEGVLVNSMRPKDEDYRSDLAGHITSVGSLF